MLALGYLQTKYQKSKSESNSAQNVLEKEITTLRESNRTMQLRLRDMEVSNDDFERQERIVMSSLEDAESKYNHSLERGVMLEEEVRLGEQEREALRIEVQRLRDELSDLKIEQEITVEKLNNTMAMAAKYGNGSLHHVPPPKFPSPLSDTSTVLTDSPSTRMTTPSAASTSTPLSDHSGPPSPPMSEISTTPSQSTAPLNDLSSTPRQRDNGQRLKKHSHGASHGGVSALPMPMPSRSLNQIRGLIGQMQRLEQRVQSARSKLPAPIVTTPPPLRRVSQHRQLPPRCDSSSSNNSSTAVPSAGFPSPTTSPFNLNAITLRSGKKQRAPSNASSVASERDGNYYPSRLSLSAADNRPALLRGIPRPESRTADSRPDSRASGTTSRSSISGGLDRGLSSIPYRPASRTSLGGSDSACGFRNERRSIGAEESMVPEFGFGPGRRNTINTLASNGSGGGVGSAIPLPRKIYGGRISGVGAASLETSRNTPQSPKTGRGAIARRPNITRRSIEK